METVRIRTQAGEPTGLSFQVPVRQNLYIAVVDRLQKRVLTARGFIDGQHAAGTWRMFIYSYFGQKTSILMVSRTGRIIRVETPPGSEKAK